MISNHPVANVSASIVTPVGGSGIAAVAGMALVPTGDSAEHPDESQVVTYTYTVCPGSAGKFPAALVWPGAAVKVGVVGATVNGDVLA
jgi:hypothetical protein